MTTLHVCHCKTLVSEVKDVIWNSFYLEYTSETEIFNILRKLQVNKGAGIDGIRPKDLKENAEILCPVVANLINKIFTSNQIPDFMKKSIIRPIFKSGRKSDYNNYRPISILPVLEKVFEEVLVTRLTSYLAKNKIINQNQYGFQKGKSINKLLGNFADVLNTNMSKNVHSLVLFIDFSKAFDTIPHKKLLEALENIGIRGMCLDLFKNYLSCRSFVVKIGEELSDCKSIQYGVPQGSKLGPILYLIFANNLLKNIDCTNVFAYADDTALIVSNYNVKIAASNMQKNVDIIGRWCHDNGLMINISKTKLMHIRPKHLSST